MNHFPNLQSSMRKMKIEPLEGLQSVSTFSPKLYDIFRSTNQIVGLLFGILFLISDGQALQQITDIFILLNFILTLVFLFLSFTYDY